MPRGPNGERRPADVVGCAVHVMKIAVVSQFSSQDSKFTLD